MWKSLPGVFTVAACLLAQPSPQPVGHWEGSLKAPDQNVAVTVDLARNQKGEWIGSMSMPAQGARDIPLSSIAVHGNAVHFAMLSAPGAPVFDGKLSADGKAMAGNFSAGPESIPFELKRTGEAVISAPPPSTPLSKEFEGTWEGTLDADSQQLRLALKLARGADGAAVGTLTSVDQGNVEIPVAGVTEKDKVLTLDIRAVGGSFTGTLSADGSQIAGKFTQAGNTMPLVFKRTR